MATLLTSKQQRFGRQLVQRFDQLEGFVPGEGPHNPVFVLISEAPGRVEVQVGHPFQGPAGTELDRWLTLLGLTRSQVYMTGAVRSRPYLIGKTGLKRDRRPSRAEIIASAPLLDSELAQLKDHLLVPLGNTGLQRLLGRQQKISAVHGQLLRMPIQGWDEERQQFTRTATTYPIFPLYHPSYSRRFNKMVPVVNRDLARLDAILSQNGAKK